MDSRADVIVTFGQVVAGLCLVGVVVWAAIEAVSADPAVGGSIVVAVLGLAGVVFERSRVELERRRDVQRDRMESTYEDFVWRAYKRFQAKGVVETPEDEAFFTELKAKLLIVGADAAVISAFVAFGQTKNSESDPNAGARAYERLLRSIRRDLGHRDWGLSEGELLRVFTDYQ